MFPAFAQPLPETELPPQGAVPGEASPPLTTVKRLIWLYFWLLIFEGALRKWVLPGWSNPLLLVRDPVVILIYVFAVMAGIFPNDRFIAWIIGLGLVTFVFSEIAGTGNLLVSLFGLRTNFLHLPLIFVIPKVFDRRELDRMAKWLFITCVPMALLMLAQFRAPSDGWLNNGAGGMQDGQLSSAMGKIRPPGTFSFTAGVGCYLSVVAALTMHTLMEKRSKNRIYAMVALPAIGAMVGISGSRGTVGSMTIIMAAVAVIWVKKPAFLGRSIKTVLMVGVVYFALASWSDFQQGIEVHQERFETGGGLKEGIFVRFFGGFLPISALVNAPFLGVGLGMGTNAASAFLYGKVTFSLGENEWDRVLYESGPILGLAFIGFRIALLVFLTRRAFESLNRDNPLPLLLLAAGFLQILNGQFGVPMLLGWAVFTGGLCLAATNLGVEAVPVSASAPESTPVAVASFRGRSVFANELHGEIEDPHTARFGP